MPGGILLSCEAMTANFQIAHFSSRPDSRAEQVCVLNIYLEYNIKKDLPNTSFRYRQDAKVRLASDCRVLRGINLGLTN